MEGIKVRITQPNGQVDIRDYKFIKVCENRNLDVFKAEDDKFIYELLRNRFTGKVYNDAYHCVAEVL